MVAERLNVINGYISQDMTDANTNFENIWPYLSEIETARSGEASLDERINTAETSAGASALAAASSASSAADDAAAAAASASEAEGYADALTTTSTTSLLIENGEKTFTVESDLKFAAGQFVSAISAADPSNYMHGAVTSYAGTTLVISVSNHGGAGTFADWGISLSGSQGAQGDTGLTGANGVDGYSYQTLLYSVVADADNEVVFDEEIDGTYKEYIITSTDVTFPSSSGYIRCQVGTGSTPTFQTTGYSCKSSSSSVLTNLSSAQLTRVPTTAPYSGDLRISIIDPSDATKYKIILSTSSTLYDDSGTLTPLFNWVVATWAGGYNAITAIKLFPVSGTLSGTFNLYGVA